jgi:hypothetical protein
METRICNRSGCSAFETRTIPATRTGNTGAGNTGTAGTGAVVTVPNGAGAVNSGTTSGGATSRGGSSSTAADNANHGQPYCDSGNVGWTDIEAGIRKARKGDTVTITMNGHASLPNGILFAARESGVILVIKKDNGLVITIAPESITDAARTIDITIDITATTAGDSVLSENGVVITPAAHGQFGFEISFNITAAQLKAAGLNGNNVELLHFDDDGAVTEAGFVKLNSDGSLTITISHASFYALVEATETIDVSSGAGLSTRSDILRPDGSVTSTALRILIAAAVVSTITLTPIAANIISRRRGKRYRTTK